MANDPTTRTDQAADVADPARVTYRYLRVGLVGAVLLVAVSILLEHFDRTPDCFQYSASAYYYTPVRTIFVGALFAIGIALIAIKGGKDTEDWSLTFAGALALVVAIIPTTNVNPHCPLTAFDHDPVKHQELKPWVVTSVDNNMRALLITASLGILCGALFVVLRHPSIQGVKELARDSSRNAQVTLGVMVLFVAFLWIAYAGFHDAFYKRAHALSATGMVLFLGIAVFINARQHHEDEKRGYFRLYVVILALMIVSAVVAFAASGSWNHWVLGIETLELLWIGVFWVAQTKEHWSKDSKLT